MALVLPFLLAACAGPASLTGHPEAELRSRMGAPQAEYANADGSRTLAYPTGRLGTQTFMAEVTPGGEVRSVRSALTDETFQDIQVGMRRDQILRLIGPPRETMRFPRLGEDSWEYYFVDTWGYRALFFVNFDAAGMVVSKFTRRIDNHRNDR